MSENNKMPVFNREKYLNWVTGERSTAKYVQIIWNALEEKQKKDPKVLVFLTQCGWINKSQDYKEPTRRWRNYNLAKLLGHDYVDDAKLEIALLDKWPKMNETSARWIIKTSVGITHAFKPHRPGAIKYIHEHAANINRAFHFVSEKGAVAETKIRKVFNAIGDDLYIKTPNGGSTSIINAISPVLACLDPNTKFPIMNQMTARLLRAIDKQPDAYGSIAFIELISKKTNVRDAFELDVYSQEMNFPVMKRMSRKADAALYGTKAKDLRIKSEEHSYYSISKQMREITKQHNILINTFRKIYLWEYKIEEGLFDLYLPKYKRGRGLLIEAKTASSGVNGRSQIRQAIGQLFDYRRTNFPVDKNIDLAVLLPKKPSQDIIDLLGSLNIYTLWLNNKDIDGTLRI